MSDARTRPSQSGKSIACLLAVSIITATSASPVDAKRIRVHGFSSSSQKSEHAQTSTAQTSQAEPTSAPAPLSSAAPSEAAPVEAAKPVDPMADDDRTKKILAEENRGIGKLHPLQTSNPGYNIVVCEAGCGDAKPRIIYQRPVAAVRSASAEPNTPALPSAKEAECRGGCDGGPTERPRSITGAAPSFLNDAAGNWLTTVEPETKSATPASPAAATMKPQASKGSREDWMARINRERASKSPEPSEPEVVFPSEPEVRESPLVPEPSNIREQ